MTTPAIDITENAWRLALLGAARAAIAHLATALPQLRLTEADPAQPDTATATWTSPAGHSGTLHLDAAREARLEIEGVARETARQLVDTVTDEPGCWETFTKATSGHSSASGTFHFPDGDAYHEAKFDNAGTVSLRLEMLNVPEVRELLAMLPNA
jgi:hypothetical protein